MPHALANVVNIEDVGWTESRGPGLYHSLDASLTPALQPRQGRLGVTLTRVLPGHTGCPFHTHAIEDEVFYVLSGRGVLRYGERLERIGPGDCISCPAGSGIAHQIANPYEAELVMMCIGMNDPREVCTYPDSGKVMVRALQRTGRLEPAPYYDGEPAPPRIFELAAALEGG